MFGTANIAILGSMTNSNRENVEGIRALPSPPIENNLRFETVTDIKRLFSLKPHWDDLCQRSSDYNLSQSFQWCYASWNFMVDPSRRQLYCLVGWMDHRMVLIWPFVIQRRGLWFELRPLGSETSVYSDVLVEDSLDADSWIELAWRELRASSNGDVVDLPLVRIDSRLHSLISRQGSVPVWGTSTTGVSWDGHDRWESYSRSRKRNFRTLKRGRRRLTKRGDLTFEVVKDHEQFRSTLNWLFVYKDEWLIRTKRNSAWRDAARYQKFLSKVVAEKSETGNIVLFVLKLDGQIISALLVLISKRTAEAVSVAFDPSFSRYSPGQLLIEDVLKWTFSRRLKFDFQTGNEVYKSYWSNHESAVVSYRFINSAWGAIFPLALRCHSALRSLRHSITGFRALGLFGWRRKRKTQAAI